MLKINDKKWDYFCEKAGELGFDKFYNYDFLGRKRPCFIFPKGTFSYNDVLIDGKDCIFINTSCLGEQDEHEIICTYSNVKNETIINIAKRPQLDKLFDLIKADLVEKVEG